jgi:hypothetical protein
MGRSLIGALGAIGGARGVKSLMNEFERFDELAARFETTAEAIQKVGFVAEQNGSDVEMFADALARARRNLADSSNNAVQEAAQALGLDIGRYLKSQPLEQLGMLSDAFIKSGGGAKQSSDMFKILGRTVENMVPTLRMGSEEILKLGGSIGIMSNEAVAEIGRVNDEFDKFFTNIKVGTMKAIVGLASIPKVLKDIKSELWDEKFRVKIDAPLDPAKLKAEVEADRAAKKAQIAAEKEALEEKKKTLTDILSIEKERTKIGFEDLDIQERATKQALKRFQSQGGLDGFAMLQTRGNLGERGGMMRSRTFAPGAGVPTMPGANSGVDRQFNEIAIREFRAMTEETKTTNTILKEAVGD